MLFSEKIQKDKSSVFLLQAADKTGHDAWYYVFVESKKIPLFKHITKQETYDLSSIGQVLFSGYGTQPPASITAKVNEQYNTSFT